MRPIIPIAARKIISPYLKAFSSKNSYKTGTKFTVQAQSRSDVYVYLIGYSSNTKLVEEIPHGDFYFDAHNRAIVLPHDKSTIILDEHVGTDYLVVLYSLEALNIKELCKKIQATKGDDFVKRLHDAHRNKIVASENMTFDKDNIRFTAHPNGKTLLPIVIAIEHN